MIQCILDWFKDNSDAVTGLTSFGALVIAIVGFGLTIHQLRQAQIALRAGNIYTIQKDARELIQQTMKNPSFFDFIMNHDPKKKYAQKTVAEANRCLAVMFNFYLSIFRQYKIKGISAEFAQSMGRDFFNFFSSEMVQAYYHKQMEANVYDEEHYGMVDLWGSSQADKSRL